MTSHNYETPTLRELAAPYRDADPGIESLDIATLMIADLQPDQLTTATQNSVSEPGLAGQIRRKTTSLSIRSRRRTAALCGLAGLGISAAVLFGLGAEANDADSGEARSLSEIELGYTDPMITDDFKVLGVIASAAASTVVGRHLATQRAPIYAQRQARRRIGEALTTD